MAQGSFVVMVAGISPEDMKEYVKDYMERMMKHSRQNAGCKTYNVHQSLHNPCEFMMYSEWESEVAFENHNATEEMQEFLGGLAKHMFEVTSPKTYWHVLPE
ncbi:MAG: antibiotic biosynthesis monooxygenase [Coxiellaceae bacterium]|nr:antibiotic biosynthesis monooxygenase [Coxiellaceae bacterium]